ncbi:MAG: amidohydrolase family protein [Pseudomonadota bacterium]
MTPPPGATDCHVHIFDPRFPCAPGREQPASTVDDLLRLRRRLGLSRSVIVHPSSYGADNRALFDALERLGDSARGVAWVTPATTDEELRHMHALGVRGIRLYLARDNAPTAQDLRAYATRIAPMGWHIELVVKGPQLMAAEQALMDLPCPIVLDHFAHLKQPEGLRQPAGEAVLRLLGKGNTYLKLSCVYAVSADAGFGDLAPTAREFIAAAPDRMLWGTDWPHTTVKSGPKPDAARLFDLLAAWEPASAVRDRILVDNPARLYGFA